MRTKEQPHDPQVLPTPERTMAGLQAARARGRKGGRKFALTKAQVQMAQAARANRDTSVSELCSELGVKPVTRTGTSILKATCANMENACSTLKVSFCTQPEQTP